MRILTAGMIAGLALVAGCTSTGSDDNGVRYKPFFGAGATGGCKADWKKYLAASGHSAYAITLKNPSGTRICGAAYNAGSQQAAENRALSACEAGRKRYKLGVKSKCEIAASK